MTEKEIKDEVELIEVPTQTAPAFKVGEEILDANKLLCKIANDIASIKRKL